MSVTLLSPVTGLESACGQQGTEGGSTCASFVSAGEETDAAGGYSHGSRASMASPPRLAFDSLFSTQTLYRGGPLHQEVSSPAASAFAEAAAGHPSFPAPDLRAMVAAGHGEHPHAAAPASSGSQRQPACDRSSRGFGSDDGLGLLGGGQQPAFGSSAEGDGAATGIGVGTYEGTVRRGRPKLAGLFSRTHSSPVGGADYVAELDILRRPPQ
jgi:hypothetical protein